MAVFKPTEVVPEAQLEGQEQKQQVKLNLFQRLFKKDKNEKPKEESIRFYELFRFATKMDILFMVIGSAAALGNGTILPITLIVFSNIINSFSFDATAFCFQNATINGSNSTVLNGFDLNSFSGLLSEKIRQQVVYLVLLGIATMVFGYFQITFWMIPCEKQTRVIRKRLFNSILRQEIGWFDVYKSGELTNRMTDDVNKIKDGIGDKLAGGLQYFSSFICGITIGFVKGWKLTLVILSLSPLFIIVAVLFSRVIGSSTEVELKSYAKAGAIAEEVLTLIRTVFAFNGAKKEHKRYESKLDGARRSGIKKGVLNGCIIGCLWLVLESGYALGFWYGWTLTLEKDPDTGLKTFTVGQILNVFFGIIIGLFSLGNVAPFISTFSSAKAAAYEIFKIIDRKSQIDIESTEGQVLDNLKGKIEFKNVEFKYPSRKELQVLNKLSFTVEHGKTIALVGASGCGKSTCVQLLQRFYDPFSGAVFIDDVNVSDLSLYWWRKQIGVVNQEPVLFANTIGENIRIGKEDATQKEIEEAAKNANAHNFIMKLPEKYNTLVGDRGSQLSGGQKQRIAIARALVRNPKILLLDEATSALDNESESIVQAALDKASYGRTTIVIAHRLSTVKNADIIFALDNGVVVEYGTHDELMKNKNVYFNLVLKQQTMSDDDGQRKKSGKAHSKTEKDVDDVSLVEDTKSEKADEKVDSKEVKDPPFAKVLALNKPEWYIIIIGCIASLCAGAVPPLFGLVFSKIIVVFQKCTIEEQRQGIILFCLIFVAFGVTLFIANILLGSMFTIAGENLTKRLRTRTFKAILSQEIAWFDEPKNNVGSLCTRLSVEAAAVQGATGIRFGFLLQTFANLGIGIGLAFGHGWALTLVILGFLPLLVLSAILQTRLLTGFSNKDKKNLEDAGKITGEAINNIRTIVVLHKETYFFDLYVKTIDIPYNAALRSANIYGIMFGFTQSIMSYANAAVFAFGAYLIENSLFGMDFEKLMIVYSAIIFGSYNLGQTSSFVPDYVKAKESVRKIFELFERKPAINNWESESTKQIIDEKFNGRIELNSVDFTYPQRNNAPILQKFSLNIEKGQRIALVGSSGCGKSTITQLLERFYDVTAGEVKISNEKLKDLDLFWLRSQIGIVSQEPILFDATIEENIAYGDTSRVVSLDEIIAAAKQANAHDFITKQPDGYKTNVGSKGTQLSGGQKQRIAIARALVRNPKILILDEATSALDTESEKLVEEALERAQQGRTCIVIAHRLSTIKDADVIYVIQAGQVIEKSTHAELLKLNGFYAKLCTLQTAK